LGVREQRLERILGLRADPSHGSSAKPSKVGREPPRRVSLETAPARHHRYFARLYPLMAVELGVVLQNLPPVGFSLRSFTGTGPRGPGEPRRFPAAARTEPHPVAGKGCAAWFGVHAVAYVPVNGTQDSAWGRVAPS
jgi:hypothetical protein